MKIQGVIICFQLLLLSIGLQAQISFAGNIVDENDSPLEMANIVVYEQPTNSLATFTTSDKNGNFKVKLHKNSNYIIKISFIGLQTKEISIQTKEENIEKKIKLYSNNQLEQVNIVHTMPVSIKGDTIIYDADSFTNGTEKKLENILEKLPGVEVEENGDIKVEGKKVKKVMVEGKDFFEGDTKLATKNIPASAVDKVEVLRNHSDISQLKQITDNEDNVALNIKLKEGKKRFWFGDINLIAGLKERYLAHPNLFYYSPKYSVNIIADINNIGKQSFTWGDYFKFMGGFSGLSSKSTVKSSSDLNFLTMQNDKAKSSKNRFGAANFHYNPNDKLNFSGFTIYSRTNTTLQNRTSKKYYNGGSNATLAEKINQLTSQNNKLGIAKFKTTYIPNINNQLDYDLIVKFSDFTEKNNIYSTIADDIFNKNKNRPKSISHNLSYYLTLDDKNIFAFLSQYSWNKENPFYNTIFKNFPFADILQLNKLQKHYHLNQKKEIITDKLELKLDYYYILNNKSNLNFNIGYNYTKQNLDLSIQQLLDNKNFLTVEKLNNNDYNVNDKYIGLGLRFLAGKFTMFPLFTYHNYTKKIDQVTNGTIKYIHKVLPSLSIKYKIKKSETLTFRYNKSVQFTDINNVVEAYVLNGYNMLFEGNNQLKPIKKHKFTLSYYNFDAFNFSNYSGYINYTKSIDNVRRRAADKDLFFINSPINSAFSDDLLSASFNFHKSYPFFKISLGSNMSYSTYYSQREAKEKKSELIDDIKNTTFTHAYSAKFLSNLKGFFNFDIGYRLSISKFKNNNYNQQYIQHSPFTKIEINFLKYFMFQTDYTYHLYKDKNQLINRYSFWNSELMYQKNKSNWEFKLSCTNILNTSSLNTNSGNELYHSVSSYIIQPRYITFGVTYNL